MDDSRNDENDVLSVAAAVAAAVNQVVTDSGGVVYIHNEAETVVYEDEEEMEVIDYASLLHDVPTEYLIRELREREPTDRTASGRNLGVPFRTKRAAQAQVDSKNTETRYVADDPRQGPHP